MIEVKIRKRRTIPYYTLPIYRKKNTSSWFWELEIKIDGATFTSKRGYTSEKAALRAAENLRTSFDKPVSE